MVDMTRTAFSCSRYHEHEGRSAFSRHLVNSGDATSQSNRHNHMRDERTLGLGLTADTGALVVLRRCLGRRSRLSRRGARAAKEHAGQTVADGRADRDGASGGSHLRKHAGARGAGLGLRRHRRCVVGRRCGMGRGGGVRTPRLCGGGGRAGSRTRRAGLALRRGWI